MSQLQTENHCVDRETLYVELWEVPGTQLSRKYGVSDVALGKACRRHNIPRPPKGYWSQRKYGYQIERTPLPVVTDPQLQKVQFHPQPAIFGDTVTNGASGQMAVNRAPILISEHLLSPHALVEQTRIQLRAGTPDDNRIVHSDPKTALNIAVASDSITRALKIMDALIRAWEEVGGSVKLGVKSFLGHYSTAFAIGPYEVLVSLKELPEPLPNGTPEKRRLRRYPPSRPNGRLVFSIENFQSEGLRLNWADGTHQRLEKILNRILDGLVAQIENRKRHRLDNECHARQKNAIEQLRLAKQQHNEKEKERRESLAVQVDRWHYAERIRAYLKAINQFVESGEMRIIDERNFREWSEWASWYADSLDPLFKVAPRPEVAKPPTNKLLDEFDITPRTKSVLIALGVQDAESMHKITQKQIDEIETQYPGVVWSEICRVLEALGYDVSGRNCYS
ncbi:MAG TPA: hypothetical protein VMG59_12185 [Phycisphaerae bacterium]|nr:hypothetical protein [Phycisphaerae bacterium]